MQCPKCKKDCLESVLQTQDSYNPLNFYGHEQTETIILECQNCFYTENPDDSLNINLDTYLL